MGDGSYADYLATVRQQERWDRDRFHGHPAPPAMLERPMPTLIRGTVTFKGADDDDNYDWSQAVTFTMDLRDPQPITLGITYVDLSQDVLT